MRHANVAVLQQTNESPVTLQYITANPTPPPRPYDLIAIEPHEGPPIDGADIFIASFPVGIYQGIRVHETGFEPCFQSVFEHAENLEDAIVAAKVWEAAIHP